MSVTDEELEEEIQAEMKRARDKAPDKVTPFDKGPYVFAHARLYRLNLIETETSMFLKQNEDGSFSLPENDGILPRLEPKEHCLFSLSLSRPPKLSDLLSAIERLMVETTP